MKQQIDNGYRVWTAKGKQVFAANLNKCHAVLWRPRPSPLLTKPQIRELKKRLPELIPAMEAHDEKLSSLFATGAAKARFLTKEAWEKYRASKAQEIADFKLRSFDLEKSIEIEVIEEIVA